MHFSLAWRNIWRHPKRTAIVITAVVIGVWSMILFTGLMIGMLEGMIDNAISTLTGHIQIHRPGFRDDPVIEKSMADSKFLDKTVQDSLVPGGKWAKRIRAGAVAQNARHSAGVSLVGIEPEREPEISFYGKVMHDGRKLAADDKNKIVIGKALAEKFETKVGRKLVLMSQDAEGQTASRAFKIVGIYRAELESTEKSFLFIPLSEAQKMLKAPRQISEICILLPEIEDVDNTAAALTTKLDPQNYKIETWRELQSFIAAYLEVFDQFLYLWYFVVFIAMGFGIVNTGLMAVLERIREFGLLKSLGMKPLSIIKGVLAEAFFQLVIGLVIGDGLGLLSLLALAENGIDLSSFSSGSEMFGMSRVIYPALDLKSIIVANAIVFFLGLLVSLYPAVKAARITPVQALAHT